MTDLAAIPSSIVSTDLAARPTQLDLTIAAWLDAKSGRSGSGRTARAYRDTLASFRVSVRDVGLDLDSDPDALALIAQHWAGRDDPRATTYNQRLAIISSFYVYAIRAHLLHANPVSNVERRVVQDYAEARALDPAVVQKRLRQIDRAQLAGARDYALLAVGLQTGRRVSELQALLWADIHMDDQQQITVTWQRCKGNKVLRDTLPRPLSNALMAYLHRFYGMALGDLPHHAPVWVALAPSVRGHALTAQSISRVCQQRLGVSSVHVLRHTFAHSMEMAGARVSEIQARLGHANLATTSKYLQALKQAHNPHADLLAQLLGLDA